MTNETSAKANILDDTIEPGGVMKIEDWHGLSEKQVERYLEDGYEIRTKEGLIEFYLNGVLHREDGPAWYHIGGSRKWCQNGKLHREDGPAIIDVRGYLHWYIDGQRHRVGGPAYIEPTGDMFYYQNDVLHREDGPAVARVNGKNETWVNGVQKV